MAENAFQTGIVLFGINAGDPFSFTGRVRKAGMAAQTKLPAAVDDHLGYCFRMTKRRTVTIFTRDDAVQVLAAGLYLFTVTFYAVFVHVLPTRTRESHGHILPLLFVGLSVEGVHETV
jgi:hypothetical protein